MKVVAGIILTFLLGAMFVGLFNLSAGMDMSGSMEDCQYMSHEEVVCPMTLLGHLDVWKSSFMATLLPLLLLYFAAGALVGAVSVAPNLLLRKYIFRICICYARLRERTYAFSSRFFQELFSSGILHPKLF